MGILGFATSRREIFDGDTQGGSSELNKAPYCYESIVTYDATPVTTIEWKPVSEAWISLYFKCEENFETQGTALYIYDENGDGIFRLRKPHQETSRLDSEYFDGISWTAFDTTWATDVTTLTRIDVHILMDATGTIQVYKDKTLHATFSGDTTNTASRTGIGSLGIGDLNETSGTGGTAYYSAIIAADEDSLIMDYVQTKPGADGDYTEWSGNYTLIDGVGFDDNSSISTGGAGNRYVATPFNLTSDFDQQREVVAVCVGARSFQGSVTAPLNGIEPIVSYNGTVSNQGTQTLTPTKSAYTEIFNTNPQDGFPWSVPAAKSAQFGVRATNQEFVLLTGDEQTGTDQLTLTGDENDGFRESKLKLEGNS